MSNAIVIYNIGLYKSIFCPLSSNQLAPEGTTVSVTMIYPRASFVKGILVVLGTHPLHEKKRVNWRQKVHRIGLFFCALQLVLTTYTFVLEQREDAYGSSNGNNILRGSVLIKRLFALLLPPFTIVLRFTGLRCLEQFFGRIELFDVFLQSTGHRVGLEYACLEQEMEQKIRKVNFFAGVFVVLAELFNIVTAFNYMINVREIMPSITTFYFYHSGITIFIATSLNIYSTLYGVLLRHELFNAFAEDIWECGWQEEIGQLRQRRRVLKGLIPQEEGIGK